MMLPRTTTGVLLASTATVLSLVACTAPATESVGSTGGQVQLTYAYWNSDKKGPTKTLIEDFQKSHPNITVTTQVTPGKEYWTKLQTTISSGTAPDVVNMNGPNFELYAKNGVLAPLDKYIARDRVDVGAFPAGLVDLYRLDGKEYALPENMATIALWYNKSLFDKANVSYPTDAWTWSELQTAAKKISDAGLGVRGIAAGSDAAQTAQECYYNTIVQAGGSVISEDGTKSGYDNPKTIQGLKFWSDLITSGASPTSAQMIQTAPSDMFATGKVAMFYGGTWRAAEFRDSAVAKDVNVAPLPAGPAGKGTTVHGVGNAITSGSKHPEEAWEFVKFLESKQGQEMAGSSGALIPAYQGTAEKWVQSMPQYNLKVYVDALAYAKPFPVSQNTDVWKSKADAFFAQAWAGQISVEDAAKKAAESMNAALAKEKH